MRFFQNANYDFMGRRKRLYTVSGVLLAIALVFGIISQIRTGSFLNYGVDFTGGTVMQLSFSQPMEDGRLRSAVETAVPGTEVTSLGDENDFMIRAPRFSDEGEQSTSDLIQGALRQHFGDTFVVERTEAVGPKVGNELQRRAAIAVILSFLATLLYLAFRIETRFGIAAVIATMHDILLTLGFISVLQLDVSLPTVAAVLTIVGYSLNDTIIIFDRIKENLIKLGRRADYVELLNRSINETLPRTVLTASTTIATLVSLFIFTQGQLRDFALILIFGIVMGTYSSIFIASPALLEIERRWPRPLESKTPRPRRTAGAGA